MKNNNRFLKYIQIIIKYHQTQIKSLESLNRILAFAVNTDAVQGDVLVWDDTNSKWVAQSPRVVTHFTATTDQTAFSVPYRDADNVDVYVNGALLRGDGIQYTLTLNTTLTLKVGVPEGTYVTTHSYA